MSRILVGCESSGIVREAFRALGHDAWSCDILPADDGSPFHLQCDLLGVLGWGWDMLIGFPPCTFICSSGLHWNDRGRGWQGTEDALQFVADLMNAPIDRIAIENPQGCISTRLEFTNGMWRVRERGLHGITCPATQTIQPNEFGEDASKSTTLRLKNLPRLAATKYVQPRITADGKRRWANQTDSGQNKLPPSRDRWKQRSKTYQGIADAMAAQWSHFPAQPITETQSDLDL